MDAKPSWNTVLAGQTIPTFERTTDLAHWNRYAAINDEFIPLHMDPEAARAAGQRDVFGMGNLRLAYLHNLLHDWLGAEGDIASLSCQFRGLNFKGDVLRARGTITEKRERDGAKLVDLDLSVINQSGEDTTPGKATAILFENRKGTTPPEPETPALKGNRQPGVYLDSKTLDWLGKSLDPRRSFPVGSNDIRRWATAVYYPEPPPNEFYDEESAARGPWGGLVAPRDFNPFAWMQRRDAGIPWMRGMGVEPGHRVLNGGQASHYFAPIRPGDAISAVTSLLDAYEKEGKLGTMLFLITETRWTNQREELVKIGHMTTIYY